MMGVEDLTIAGQSVSRETMAKLEAFEALVRRWTPAINLVSASSLPEIWQRHVADSAQLFALCPRTAETWADLGAGGGFPGLVVAVLAQEALPKLAVTLVESDLRKATFLRETVRTLKLNARVLSTRIESVPPLAADVVSARALTALPGLLAYAERHLQPEGLALFPKGAKYEDEVAEARKLWSFDVDLQPSLSQPGAAILVIRKIERAKNV
jgi:16S rRNA (guanine527-N7)-methyltransferase